MAKGTRISDLAKNLGKTYGVTITPAFMIHFAKEQKVEVKNPSPSSSFAYDDVLLLEECFAEKHPTQSEIDAFTQSQAVVKSVKPKPEPKKEKEKEKEKKPKVVKEPAATEAGTDEASAAPKKKKVPAPSKAPAKDVVKEKEPVAPVVAETETETVTVTAPVAPVEPVAFPGLLADNDDRPLGIGEIERPEPPVVAKPVIPMLPRQPISPERAAFIRRQQERPLPQPVSKKKFELKQPPQKRESPERKEHPKAPPREKEEQKGLEALQAVVKLADGTTPGTVTPVAGAPASTEPKNPIIKRAPLPMIRVKKVKPKKKMLGPAKKKSSMSIFDDLEDEAFPGLAKQPAAVSFDPMESYVEELDNKPKVQKIGKQDEAKPIDKTKFRFRHRPKERRRTQAPVAPVMPSKIQIAPPVTLRDLSSKLGVKATAMQLFLMRNGMQTTINSPLDEEAVMNLSVQYNCEIEVVAAPDAAKQMATIAKDGLAKAADEHSKPRPPVITFLGHVDHGKTTLMDRICATALVDTEHGGITQHIRAHYVNTPFGQMTFLDTPGHQAFTEMRGRGANVTDIVVLIVAADDGVMPQTEEAVSHAKAAKAEIIVAMTKMDMPGANVNRVKQQLAVLELLPSDWGGSIECVEVCAPKNQGVDKLLETIHLHAEMLELKGNPEANARGHVIEARLEKGRGPVATLLVRDGCLKIGQYILVDQAIGTVRAMTDEHGNPITMAGPGMPVEVAGIDEVPDMGARFIVHDDLQELRKISDDVKRSKLSGSQVARPVGLADLFSGAKAQAINVILKADVKGSIEVLSKTLTQMNNQEVKVNVIHSAVGSVNEGDITLADASNALIIGFHVNVEDAARTLAEKRKVEIKLYYILYQLTDDIKAAMEGKLAPVEKEVFDGTVSIRDIFKVSRIGTIAGCQVARGKVLRSSKIRLFRNGVLVHSGYIESLKRFKDDAREVEEGFECGLKINYDDLKVGDSIEAYHIERISRTLEDVTSGKSEKSEGKR